MLFNFFAKKKVDKSELNPAGSGFSRGAVGVSGGAP